MQDDHNDEGSKGGVSFMEIEKRTANGLDVAVVRSSDESVLMADSQSALDLAMTVQYETGTNRLVLSKEAIAEDFFRLSTGLAGEILQKFINYQIKLAIVGDFSGYTSKPLRDFIRECNRGRNFFFTATEDEAMMFLTRLKQ